MRRHIKRKGILFQSTKMTEAKYLNPESFVSIMLKADKILM